VSLPSQLRGTDWYAAFYQKAADQGVTSTLASLTTAIIYLRDDHHG
jgi:hypothetical protein